MNALILAATLCSSSGPGTTDQLEVQFDQWIQRWADRFLAQGTEKRGNGRILFVSRDVFAKVATLSKTYERTHDRRYSDRITKELLAVSDFPDWNPDNYLGTAEMVAAVSLGLQEVSGTASNSEIAKIRDALIRLGVKPGLDAYDRHDEWTERSNNWTQVCASSLGLAALSLRDSDPSLSATLMTKVRGSLARVADDYGPDGVPGEGPVYYRFGMGYQSLLDHHLKLAQLPGVLNDPAYQKTAFFAPATLSPTGQTFNYADSSTSFWVNPSYLWVAQPNQKPQITSWIRGELGRFLALPVTNIWNEEWRFLPFLAGELGTDPGGSSLPLDFALTGHQQIATFRSSWDDPNAAYLGVKGGDNATPHAHLDLGSFIFDWGGYRWAADLGKDDYDLPGYFEGKTGGRRWNVFRCGSASHNEITIGDRNQIVAAKASLNTSLIGNSPSVAIDLSKAYAGMADRVTRTITFVDRQSLRISDEIRRASGEVKWQWITPATATVTADGVVLRQGEKSVSIKSVGSLQGRFVIAPCAPPTAAENQNAGFTKVSFVATAKSGTITMEIRPIEAHPELARQSRLEAAIRHDNDLQDRGTSRPSAVHTKRRGTASSHS